jgi:low temperature requirement protein LtrA
VSDASAKSVGRHASWLELFFDLVVVVAVAQLAHLLAGHEDTTADDLITFVVLYLAIWLLWTSFTLYANVAGENTWRQSMLAGMAGIAVMAAAIPEARGERGTAFALAYVVTRVLAMRSWGGTGTVLLSWPAAQRGAGLIPWIVSLWFGHPAQFRLWAAGVVIDLWFSIAAGRDPERTRQQLVELQRRRKRRRETDLTVAEPDLPHLGERLGLFVIIVLGEAVIQIVGTASEATWDWWLAAAGAAGFALIIGMWWLSFEYGFGGGIAIPGVLLMPAHFLAVVSITAVAAGIGMTAAHPTEHLPTLSRWVLCAGLAAFILVAAALMRPARGRPVQAVLVLLPVVPAVLGWAMPAIALLGCLVAVLGGQAAYFWWAFRRA